MKGIAQRGNQLAYGSFGIKALESTWITGRQIEAARQAITRYMKREGQIWIRIFPDKPVEDPSIIKKSRRDIARMLTILRQKNPKC